MLANIADPLLYMLALGYGLGYWFGDEISSILASIRHLKHIITWVIFVGITALVIQQVLKYRTAKRETKRANVKA